MNHTRCFLIGQLQWLHQHQVEGCQAGCRTDLMGWRDTARVILNERDIQISIKLTKAIYSGLGWSETSIKVIFSRSRFLFVTYTII